MSYTVKKVGHASWDDLRGKTISFKWSDGWEDYDPMMVFHETQPFEEMGQNRYYIMDADGGGYAVWEGAEITVTVHERYRSPGGHPPTDKEREIIENRRQRKREPRARGGVDAWLDEEPVTLSLTRDEARALETSLEGVLEKLRERLTRGDESARLEE